LLLLDEPVSRLSSHNNSALWLLVSDSLPSVFEDFTLNVASTERPFNNNGLVASELPSEITGEQGES